MKFVKFESAYILAVGTVVALSVTIMDYCSSDDYYALCQGDKLKCEIDSTLFGTN